MVLALVRNCTADDYVQLNSNGMNYYRRCQFEIQPKSLEFFPEIGIVMWKMQVKK